MIEISESDENPIRLEDLEQDDKGINDRDEPEITTSAAPTLIPLCEEYPDSLKGLVMPNTTIEINWQDIKIDNLNKGCFSQEFEIKFK